MLSCLHRSNKKSSRTNRVCAVFTRAFGAAGLLLLLLCSSNAGLTSASAQASGVSITNPTTFEVKLRSTFRVPQTWKALQAVGVWHALPTIRPWSRGTPNTAGAAFEVKPGPGGKLELERDKLASHVNYTTRNVQPGTNLDYQTGFKLVSVDRKLSPEASRIRWGDFAGKSLPAVRAFPLDNDAKRVADDIKAAQPDPVSTLRALSTWVHDNIKWDPNATQRDTDTLATLKNRRGHCGHQSELFCALAIYLGIPVRRTYGFNLQPVKGSTATADVSGSAAVQFKTGFQHTWNEAYFPGFGWIELDVEEDEMFDIPASYVQNNSTFQNFAEWVYDSKGNGSCLRNNFDLAPLFDLQETVYYR